MRDDPLIEKLLADTAQALRQVAGDAEDMLRVVFTYLKLSHAGNVNADEMRERLGIAPDCILNRARLSEVEEDAVLELYASIEQAQAMVVMRKAASAH